LAAAYGVVYHFYASKIHLLMSYSREFTRKIYFLCCHLLYR